MSTSAMVVNLSESAHLAEWDAITAERDSLQAKLRAREITPRAYVQSWMALDLRAERLSQTAEGRKNYHESIEDCKAWLKLKNPPPLEI